MAGRPVDGVRVTYVTLQQWHHGIVLASSVIKKHLSHLGVAPGIPLGIPL